MSHRALKQAAKTPETETGEARKVVDEMLANIEKRGEAAVREYAQKLDRWTGDIVVSTAEMERRTRDIPAGIKRDIEFATERVRRFALAQKESLREFETEVAPGLTPIAMAHSQERLGIAPLRLPALSPAAAYFGWQVVEASVVRLPVRSCTSAQCFPILTRRKCSGLSKSRPLSRTPFASRGCVLSMMSRLSWVNASSARVTGAPFRALLTACASSVRLSFVGLSMTAATSGCAKQAQVDSN